MAANLYARSIFGEDALANLSIEKPLGSPPTTPVLGHVRIRAKTQVCSIPYRAITALTSTVCYIIQGMALSLGDKISLSQKLPAS